MPPQAIGEERNNGRLEIDNNAAERAICGIALGRKICSPALRRGRQAGRPSLAQIWIGNDHAPVARTASPEPPTSGRGVSGLVRRRVAREGGSHFFSKPRPRLFAVLSSSG